MTKLFMLMLALLIAPAGQAQGPKVCMKDGKELKIKGKGPKKKQKKCEKRGGTWEDRQEDPASAPKTPAEDLGTGTGW